MFRRRQPHDCLGALFPLGARSSPRVRRSEGDDGGEVVAFG